MTPKFDQLVNEWVTLAARAGRTGYKALRALKVPKGAAKFAVRNPKKLATVAAAPAVGVSHIKRGRDVSRRDPGFGCDMMKIPRDHPDCQEYINARKTGDTASKTAIKDKYKHNMERDWKVQAALMQKSEKQYGRTSGWTSRFARDFSRGVHRQPYLGAADQTKR